MYQLGIYSQDKLMAPELEQLLRKKCETEVYYYTSEDEIKRTMRYGGVQTDFFVIDMENDRHSLELAKELQQNNKLLKLIFVIDKIDDIFELFETDPVCVLQKPLKKKQVLAAVEKAVAKVEDGRSRILQLEYKGKVVRIPYQDINYIESDRRYLNIHMKKETQRVMMKLSEIDELLPDNFIRCHQSFIVNLNKVKSYNRNTIIMIDGAEVKVSRSREEDTRRRIKKYFTILSR